MPVYHLDIEVEYDFDLVGLSSHEKDYRLAWALNRHMQWKLTRTPDVRVRQKKGWSDHSRFTFIQSADQVMFTLLDNKTVDGLLMPELQQFDFLLMIEDPSQGTGDDFYKKLRKTPLLLAAFPLDVSKLKNKHQLILEENQEGY